MEKDLTTPECQALFDENPGGHQRLYRGGRAEFHLSPAPVQLLQRDQGAGRGSPCAASGQHYIWRLRIPFDQFDNPRNYLSKVQNYPKVYDNVNSLSHRGDFVAACLDLWQKRAPFGTYNVTNPGFVSTRQVVAMIQRILKPAARPSSSGPTTRNSTGVAAKTPRSNCVLDVSKLLAAGVTTPPRGGGLADAGIRPGNDWVTCLQNEPAGHRRRRIYRIEPDSSIIDRPEIRRLVNLDCLTYAGHLENLERVADHPKYTFEKTDLRDKAAVLASGGAAPHHPCPASGRRIPCGPFHHRPRRLYPNQRRWHLQSSGSLPRLLVQSAIRNPQSAIGMPFPPCFHR